MSPELMTVKENPNISQWNSEDGYEIGVNDDCYPMRIFNSKPSGALKLFLQQIIEDLPFKCHRLNTGFQVFINLPGEVPGMSGLVFQIPTDEVVQISIRAKLITTSSGLRIYKTSQRQCFFNSERQLMFFKIYTQNNCEVECLANFTKQECGCVRFSMPSNRLNVKSLFETKIYLIPIHIQDMGKHIFVALQRLSVMKKLNSDFLVRILSKA